jgi:hypothetical protein
MKFEMDDHLPLVAVQIEYNGMKMIFTIVLLDTGCSSTILDTDLCEEVGLIINWILKLHSRHEQGNSPSSCFKTAFKA